MAATGGAVTRTFHLLLNIASSNIEMAKAVRGELAMRYSKQFRLMTWRRAQNTGGWANLVLALSLSLGITTSTYGEWTETEIRLMPEYCRHAQTIMESWGTRDEQLQWEQKLGEGFAHIHHHCWALGYMQRAMRTIDRVERGRLYRSAIQDSSYVVRNVRDKNSFVLMPDVYIVRAKAYAGLREDEEALADFNAARSLNPRYVRTYLEWATVLNIREQKAAARKVVEEGLRNVPESKALARMLKELSEASK
jgi:hypothetical protein